MPYTYGGHIVRASICWMQRFNFGCFSSLPHFDTILVNMLTVDDLAAREDILSTRSARYADVYQFFSIHGDNDNYIASVCACYLVYP